MSDKKAKEIKRGFMPMGKEIRRYRLTKDTFGGKKGDIVEIRDEPIDGSYWMNNTTSGEQIQPFVDFEAIAPHGWEVDPHCPPGKEWVKPYIKDDGTYVHGFCRRR